MSARDETIVGGRQLDDLLQTLPGKMQKNVNRAGLRAGAAVFLEEVKQRIPVASGDLRNSARVTTRAKGATVSASVKVGNRVAWYSHLVEFGTKPHDIKSKQPNGSLSFDGTTVRSVMHPGTRAQPFMRPAAEAGFPAAIQAVTAKIRQRLTKEGLNAAPPLPPDTDE
jgi:HK97 gp10 family phage protein